MQTAPSRCSPAARRPVRRCRHQVPDVQWLALTAHRRDRRALLAALQAAVRNRLSEVQPDQVPGNRRQIRARCGCERAAALCCSAAVSTCACAAGYQPTAQFVRLRRAAVIEAQQSPSPGQGKQAVSTQHTCLLPLGESEARPAARLRRPPYTTKLTHWHTLEASNSFGNIYWRCCFHSFHALPISSPMAPFIRRACIPPAICTGNCTHHPTVNRTVLLHPWHQLSCDPHGQLLSRAVCHTGFRCSSTAMARVMSTGCHARSHCTCGSPTLRGVLLTCRPVLLDRRQPGLIQRSLVNPAWCSSSGSNRGQPACKALPPVLLWCGSGRQRALNNAPCSPCPHFSGSDLHPIILACCQTLSSAAP